MRRFFFYLQIAVITSAIVITAYRCAAHADEPFNAFEALQAAGVTYGAPAPTVQPEPVQPATIVCVKVKNTLQGDKIVCTEE